LRGAAGQRVIGAGAADTAKLRDLGERLACMNFAFASSSPIAGTLRT
jgi:hypothetical protein